MKLKLTALFIGLLAIIFALLPWLFVQVADWQKAFNQLISENLHQITFSHDSRNFKDIQIVKQCILLKDSVDLPLMRRNVIDPHTVKGDVSRRGRREAANDP